MVIGSVQLVPSEAVQNASWAFGRPALQARIPLFISVRSGQTLMIAYLSGMRSGLLQVFPSSVERERNIGLPDSLRMKQKRLWLASRTMQGSLRPSPPTV